ncbi:GxxExxY protein [Myxococcota bacterium]
MKLILELKAIRAVDAVHYATVRLYLKATGLEEALILNFAKPTLEIRRVGGECGGVRLAPQGKGCTETGFGVPSIHHAIPHIARCLPCFVSLCLRELFACRCCLQQQRRVRKNARG